MCHWNVISVFIRIIITMPHIRWLWHNSLIRISGVGRQPTTILRYPRYSASLCFCSILLIFCPPFPFNCAPCCSLTGSRYGSGFIQILIQDDLHDFFFNLCIVWGRQWQRYFCTIRKRKFFHHLTSKETFSIHILRLMVILVLCLAERIFQLPKAKQLYNHIKMT